MSEQPVEKVSDLPSFWELAVYRHPSVPAPLVLCKVCGLAVVDVYVLIHRGTCVIPAPIHPSGENHQS